MFSDPQSDHQTVRKSYCNAVGFRSASGSHIDSCLDRFSRFYDSTAWFRLRRSFDAHFKQGMPKTREQRLRVAAKQVADILGTQPGRAAPSRLVMSNGTVLVGNETFIASPKPKKRGLRETPKATLVKCAQCGVKVQNMKRHIRRAHSKS